MKTTLPLTRNVTTPMRLGRLRLRIATGAMLFAAAAALAATAIMPPPKLPWAAPTATIADNPEASLTQGIAVDQATNTIYVAAWNANDTIENSVVKVIDGRRCSAINASHCTPIATMTNVGPAPTWLTFDPATRTLYVTNGLTVDYGENNTISVLNAATCNAQNTSGCGQMPAAVVTTNGFLGNAETGGLVPLTLDSARHTLYIPDVDEGPVTFIDASTCNATNTSGCGQAPVITGANGDGLLVSPSNHTLYINNIGDQTISILDYSTCSAVNQSNCAPVTITPWSLPPFLLGVDETTQTIYQPLGSPPETLGSVAILDATTCNAANVSGCGNVLREIPVGNIPFWVLIDPTTKTAYVESENNNAIAVINTATCNAHTLAGCPTVPPALATGLDPTINIVINPATHTLYSQSQDTNRLWVLDTSKCNATKTSGCTDFAPTTTVGLAPIGAVVSAQTGTLYVSNQLDGTVSIIDTTLCNQHQLSGCNQTWPTINLGGSPRFEEINNATHTLYVANFNDGATPGWVSVINAATCNSQNRSNCSELAQIPVGIYPDQMAIDPVTNTIYVENRLSNSMSIINGQHCNASDVSACNQAWPSVAVGAWPQGLGFDPTRRTIYVANTNDDTVSVISTVHCAGSDTSGCTPVATVPVGAGPRSVGIVAATNTVFIGNQIDVTVSLFNGSTCNGTNTSGCPQTPPPAFLVGAFPDTAGNNGTNINGRALLFDSSKHTLYIPVPGDSDLAKVNTNQCRAGHVDNCHVKIMKQRAGGLSLTAALDDATGTVYVVNDHDGSVSVFPQ